MTPQEVEAIASVCAILAQKNITKSDIYEARVELYELLGCTRSDAQGVVDAEDIK
jgi:hypothetical protein